MTLSRPPIARCLSSRFVPVSVRCNYPTALTIAAALTAFVFNPAHGVEPVPGTLDDAPAPAGFASGTGRIANLAVVPGGNAYVLAVATQPNGSIVLAGYCSNAATNGNPAMCVQRLTANGGLDTTFVGPVGATGNGNGGFALTQHATDDRANAIAMQADGKIVLAGECWDGVVGYQFCVARLNANGTLDATFVGPNQNGAGRALLTNLGIARARNVLVQPDGKIVLSGDCRVSMNAGVYSEACVIRLNSDGTLDATFSGPPPANGNGLVRFPVGAYDFDAAGLLQQADGRLVVTGSCWPNTDPNVKRSFCAARLTGSGSFDATFSNNSGSIGTGRVAYAVGAIEANVSAAALQPDGRVLIAGRSVVSNSASHFAVVRLNGDGTLDDRFEGPAGGGGGVAVFPMGQTYDQVTAIAVQPDGRIVLIGLCSLLNENNFCVARLAPDGALDASFDGSTGYGNGRVNVEMSTVGQRNDAARALALQPDGKLLVAGACEGAGGINMACIARLNGGPFGARMCSMDVDGDGRVGATTDALIIARVALGMSGPSVLQGITLSGPRNSWSAVRDYLVLQCGMTATP